MTVLFCNSSNVFNYLVFITQHPQSHSHSDRLFLHSPPFFTPTIFFYTHHLFFTPTIFFTLTPSPNPLSHLLSVAVSLATYLPWNGAEYIPPRQHKILQSTIQARTHVLSRLLSLDSFECLICGHVPVRTFVLVHVLKTRNATICA